MIERWAVWLDAGDWERFATVWHPDGVMMSTWFQGTYKEFIRVTREWCVWHATGRKHAARKGGLSTPDGHPKLLHLWPVKLLQAGQPDYDDSAVMAMRAAASLSR